MALNAFLGCSTIRVLTMSRLLMVLALFLAISSCRPAADPLALIATYQERANQHDVDRLMAMFAEDARLDFGPMGAIEGKDRIRGIHDYDRAIQTVLRMENCTQDALTVTCQTVERNEWLLTAGIEEITYSASVFTFNEAGEIEAVSATLSPASAEALGQAMADFSTWAEMNKPVDYAALFRAGGSFKYSYENGIAVLSLLRQWQASVSAAR